MQYLNAVGKLIILPILVFWHSYTLKKINGACFSRSISQCNQLFNMFCHLDSSSHCTGTASFGRIFIKRAKYEALSFLFSVFLEPV